jgi:hypothetical protein
VSNTGLVFDVCDSQAAHGLHDEIIELVRVRAAALRILFHEGVVACFLYAMGDLVKRLVPRDIFPIV